MSNTDTDTLALAILSDANLALVEEMRTLRDQIKALKDRKDKLRLILLKELANVDTGITASGEPVITIERDDRSRIDSDRLQALYPEVYADCQKSSPVQTVRFPDE
jgi:predicted phage-related endonuclease